MNRITKDSDDADFRSARAPAPNSKEDFGRRVYRIMLAKGMNQSDLARAAGIDRNRVSSYVRGQSLPTGLFLKKLAEALGVKPTELLPEAMASEAPPPYSMAVSPDGKQMRLVADVWVPTGVGAQIIQLLTDNAATHRE